MSAADNIHDWLAAHRQPSKVTCHVQAHMQFRQATDVSMHPVQPNLLACVSSLLQVTGGLSDT